MTRLEEDLALGVVVLFVQGLLLFAIMDWQAPTKPKGIVTCYTQETDKETP